MRLSRFLYLIILLMAVTVFSCKNKEGKAHTRIFKGLYSFGPEEKLFKDCANGHEYWVADSSAQLELKYSQLGFEKPYEPVYIEVEGKRITSVKDGDGSEYDTTLVVKKVIKITKEIPKGECN
jgi:copper homeostasis protein (lipoprotein)